MYVRMDTNVICLLTVSPHPVLGIWIGELLTRGCGRVAQQSGCNYYILISDSALTNLLTSEKNALLVTSLAVQLMIVPQVPIALLVTSANFGHQNHPDQRWISLPIRSYYFLLDKHTVDEESMRCIFGQDSSNQCNFLLILELAFYNETRTVVIGVILPDAGCSTNMR